MNATPSEPRRLMYFLAYLTCSSTCAQVGKPFVAVVNMPWDIEKVHRQLLPDEPRDSHGSSYILRHIELEEAFARSFVEAMKVPSNLAQADEYLASFKTTGVSPSQGD